MKTKREVLEKFKECGMCKDIYCNECPFNNSKICEIGCTLVKLGAESMLESGDIEVEE